MALNRITIADALDPAVLGRLQERMERADKRELANKRSREINRARRAGRTIRYPRTE